MTTTFPSRWAPQHPDRIQLYTLPTPNGQKASIALEELGLPYEAHKINIMAGDQRDPEFMDVNPNAKIPAIIDPAGPDGQPLAIMESGAILIYLARKAGKLLGRTPREESEVLQWLFFQVGSVGPMFGQFGHFYMFAKGKTDTYGEDRYAQEVTRLLGVLDKRLAGREWVAGDFSIADIALVPWIQALDFYKGKDRVGYGDFANVLAWVARFEARPGVVRGKDIGA